MSDPLYSLHLGGARAVAVVQGTSWTIELPPGPVAWYVGAWSETCPEQLSAVSAFTVSPVKLVSRRRSVRQ